MKINKILIAFTLLLILSVSFVGGVFVGNIYNVIDFLCPAKASPYILEQDFVSMSGIMIPKGTIVPIRECAYMQRFNWEFAIDNAIKLNEYKGDLNESYGFSELFPKVEK